MKQWKAIVLLGLSGLAVAGGKTSAVTGPAVGTQAPEFAGRNLVTGERIPLSSQRGKFVILTFWATWCGPCRREIPVLENAQRIIGKDQLTVLANHVGYGDRSLAELVTDINSALAGATPRTPDPPPSAVAGE